jgi:uncharacterized phage infection (PIP) family protein YhgE
VLLLGVGGLVLLAVGVAIGWSRGGAASAPLQAQLQELRTKSDSLSRELAMAQSERDGLKQKLNDASGQFDQHVQQSQSLTTDLEKAKAAVAAMKKQLAEANRKLTDAQAQVQSEQQKTEAAHQAAANGEAELARLHRQVEQAQQKAAEAVRQAAQKDETIKQLQGHLQAADSRANASLSKNVKKGEHGTVVWYGPARSGNVVIENGRPNVGTVIGSIPKRLCRLELSGTGSSVATAPSAENDWSKIELKVNPTDFGVVRVDWTVIR